MDIEPLFMEQRWAILRHLGAGKQSPLQLANATKTSIANMSQQLRLLEMADFVKKEKIPNRDKGKPRTLFSLSNEYAYVVSLMGNFVEKKLLTLEDSKRAMLRIWFIEDAEIQTKVETVYHELFPLLSEIDALAVEVSKNKVTPIIGARKPSELEGKVKNAKIFASSEIRKYAATNRQKILNHDLIVLIDKDNNFQDQKISVS